MPRISPQQAGATAGGGLELGINICAFLDMIAFTEGTDNNRQPTNDEGYDVLVGGKLFTDYSTHPNVLVKLSASLSSTAAGRYQVLNRFWPHYRDLLHLPNFGPVSQDRYAIQQLKERKAIQLLEDGRFEDAVLACNNIWASLPGSPYGQHTYPMSEAKAVYVMHNGTYN